MGHHIAVFKSIKGFEIEGSSLCETEAASLLPFSTT